MNTFRKKLRDLGMEKEFVGWMKRTEPKTLEIGSRIRVIDAIGINPLRVGDTGIVKLINPEDVMVELDPSQTPWYVRKGCFEII